MNEKFAPVVTPVILQRLRNTAVNQFPMYAELAAPGIRAEDMADFRTILIARHDNISYPAKKKRIMKLLGKLPEQ